MGAEHLKDEEFDGVVVAGDVPVLVDFSASWCGPCKALAPVIDKFAEEFKGKVRTCKVDIDEAPESTKKYGIRSVPTCVVFRDGKVKGMIVGMTSREKLMALAGV